VPAGFSTVVGTPNYRPDPNTPGGYVSDQYFYNPTTGESFYTYMTERGTSLRYCGGNTFTDITGAVGWTSIVALRTWGGFGGPTNWLLFYNKQTGRMITVLWSGCNWSQVLDQKLPPGFANVTVTRNNQLLFYSTAGSGLTAHFTGAVGGPPTLQFDRTITFPAGWTNIVGDDDGNLLFYACPFRSYDGLCSAATGVLNPDGTFTSAASYRFGHWTSIVGWPSAPHLLFSYYSGTGQANTGYLNSATHTYVSLVDWI
jgi:hypothetical protein